MLLMLKKYIKFSEKISLFLIYIFNFSRNLFYHPFYDNANRIESTGDTSRQRKALGNSQVGFFTQWRMQKYCQG